MLIWIGLLFRYNLYNGAKEIIDHLIILGIPGIPENSRDFLLGLEFETIEWFRMAGKLQRTCAWERCQFFENIIGCHGLNIQLA